MVSFSIVNTLRQVLSISTSAARVPFRRPFVRFVTVAHLIVVRYVIPPRSA